MATQTTTRKEEAIEAVVANLQGRLSGGRAEGAEQFIRHYYEDIAAEDVVGADPEDLYGAALSLWQFAAQRKPGEAKIRALNPRVEKHGWHSSHTVIEIVHDDMPFLVDSVTMALNRRDITVHLVVHPQFVAERGDDGKALSLKPRGDSGNGEIPESCMHIEIDEQGAPDLLRGIETDLSAVLADVRAVVGDWRPMRDHVGDLIEEFTKTPPKKTAADETEESIAFLQWLLDDNFTFLGYREMDMGGEGRKARVEMREESGLGLLVDPSVLVFQGLRLLGRLPEGVQDYLRQPHILVMTKTSWRSTVHRPVQLDAIAIKRFNKAGNIVGVRLFVGLFTSAAYNKDPGDIPILRRKALSMLARSGYDPRSHAGKALTHVLHGYPRDELFQIGEDDLFEITRGIVQLQERQRIALFLRRDPFERFISVFVYVPRDRFNTKLRQDCERILTSAFDGKIAGHYTRMSDDVLSRLHFIIETEPGQIPPYDTREIETRLVEAGRSWADRLKHALIEAGGEEAGLQRFVRYEDAFPVAYTEAFSAHAAVYDIGCVDQALHTGTLGMNLYHPIEAGEDSFRFKIYHPGDSVALSDVLPMLENMGLKVLGEDSYGVAPAGEDRTVWIHDFELSARDGRAIDFDAVRDPFHESFARIWAGEMENDGFNRLVVSARMGWRQVVVLRAYCKYLRQAAIPFSQDYMEDTLANNPVIARQLAELFETRFDPNFKGESDVLEAGLAKEIRELLENVESLDEDRIIRRFLNAIHATVKTNFFQQAESGAPKSYISVKFDASRLEELPEPRACIFGSDR
jgi:glutamate dehydrogenase